MTHANDRLSPCGRLARHHDRDRYRVALLAPPEAREAQFAVIAFNYEIARVRELVSEPVLGQIRLQWWREAIGEIYAGRQRRHEVVEPLGDAVRRHALSRDHFDRLIDARERDLDDGPFDTLAELESYAAATAVPVIRLALQSVGQGDGGAPAEAAVHIGTAWALTGLLRAVPHHARQRRVLLPAQLLQSAGIAAGDIIAAGAAGRIAGVVETIADRARLHLAAARALHRSIPAQAKAPLRAAVFVDAHLNRLRRAGYEVFRRPTGSDAMPVGRLLWSVLRGRY